MRLIAQTPLLVGTAVVEKGRTFEAAADKAKRLIEKKLAVPAPEPAPAAKTKGTRP